MAVAFGYFILARAGSELSLLFGNVSVVWPASGWAVAAFWILGWRVTPAIVVGSLIAALMSSTPIGIAAVIASGNTAQAAVAGLGLAKVLLSRPWLWSGPPDLIDRYQPLLPQTISALVAFVIASLFSPLLSALTGTGALVISGEAPAEQFGPLLTIWWLRDTTAMLLFTPFFVMAAIPGRWRSLKLHQASCCIITLAITSALFWGDTELNINELESALLLWPLILWAGLRLGVGGTIVVNIIVVVVILLDIAVNQASHPGGGSIDSFIKLQLILGTHSILGLALACSLQDKNRLLRKSIKEELRDKEIITFFDSGPVVSIIWAHKFGGTSLRVSPNIERMLGHSKKQFMEINFNFFEFIHVNDIDRVNQEIEKSLRNRANRCEQCYRVKNNHGNWLHVRDITYISFSSDRQSPKMRTYLLDCTEEVSATNDRIKYLSAIKQSAEGVLITDSHSNIEYMNDAFSRMSGYSLDEVRGLNPRIFSTKKTDDQTYDAIRLSLFAGISWEGELVNRRKNDEEYPAHMRINVWFNLHDEKSHYISFIRDLTDIKMSQNTIFNLSHYDALTGLANRSYLETRLTELIADPSTSIDSMAAMVMNIDKFQFINEASGHECGNDILKQLAKYLVNLDPSIWMVARLGSDEFAVVLERAPSSVLSLGEMVLSLNEKIKIISEDGFLVDSTRISLSLSYGVTTFPTSKDDNSKHVLDRAEAALTRAKSRGGNNLSFFDPEIGASARQKFALQCDLRDGIDRGELRIFLQSQVNCNGAVVGAEALVRWQHPQRGLLQPGAFIPMAEETDLIVKLEQWVFAQAMALIEKSEGQGFPLQVSVNLSARHFKRADFVAWIKGLLKTMNVQPQRLTLEITESVALDDPHAIIAKMLELENLGLHFSLDDFGTGYSSLSYLKRLPISELKIDKTFVQDALTDVKDSALVETILSVSKIMNLKVVAEGVETAEQAHFFKSKGDVILQGYYFARPIPADEWMSNRSANQKINDTLHATQ